MASLRSRKAAPAATASIFDNSGSTVLRLETKSAEPAPAFTPISPEAVGAIPAEYVHGVEHEEDKGFCEEILLTVSQAARIVGRGGATINKIKAESKAQLGLVNEKKTATHVPLEIRSNFFHRFERAKMMVEDKLRELEMPISEAPVSTFDSNEFARRLGCGAPSHPQQRFPAPSSLNGGGRGQVDGPTGFGFKPPTTGKERAQPSTKPIESRPVITAAAAKPTMAVPNVLDKMEVAAEDIPYLDPNVLAEVRKAFGVKIVVSPPQQSGSSGQPSSTLYINGPADKVEAARRELEKFLHCDEKSAGKSTGSKPASSEPSCRAFSVNNQFFHSNASPAHSAGQAGTDHESDSSESGSKAGTDSATVKAAVAEEEPTSSFDLEATINPSRFVGHTGNSTPLSVEKTSTESSIRSTETVVGSGELIDGAEEPERAASSAVNSAFERIKEGLISSLRDAVICEVRSALASACAPKNVPNCGICGIRQRDMLFDCAHFTHCHECAESLAECPSCGEVVSEAKRLF